MTGPEGTLPRNERVVPAPPTEPVNTLPDAPAELSPSPRRGWPWPRWARALVGLAAVGALAASWFALPVRTVTVSGQRMLSPQRVQALAGAPAGFGWLYYGAWRARGLLDSPWVASAVVTRRFPDRVEITVQERTPAVRWREPGGRVVALSAGGVALPGATGTEKLPLVSGWGPDRLPDALRVLSALRGYNVQSVMYSPSGLTVKLEKGSVWSGDLPSLLKYAGSISMYPNQHISIYPWGVSVQE